MMSRDFLKKIAGDSTLTAGELRIIAAIMTQVKVPGDVVDVSVPSLVKITGLSERNVIRNRSALVNRGYLVATGKGKHGTHQYHLTDGLRGVTPMSGVTAASGDAAVMKPLTTVSPLATIIHSNGNIDNALLRFN